MTNDIIADLQQAMQMDREPWDETLYQRAIDEIKRLRSALDAEGNDANLLMLEIERLRAAGDALAATWHEGDLCGCNDPDCVATVAVVHAWKEARRG